MVTQRDVDYLHEPENMLSQTKFDGKEVVSELITDFSFIKGTCSNDFRKVIKPKIYFINEESYSKYHGIPSMALVLQRCFDERDEDDVAILCSNLDEADLVQSALTLKAKKLRRYTPYLENRFPTTEDKLSLLDDLNSNRKLVLITDYRSFRGCETSHSIIITNLELSFGANIFVEMLSRTIVDLDFVALPKKQSSSNNPIEDIFHEWKELEWAEHTTVEFVHDRGSKIHFQFNTSNIKEPMVIQKDPHGYNYTQRSKQNETKDAYL